MDTSKEFIKMCEKAEEIQKEWYPKNGDFFCNKRYEDNIKIGAAIILTRGSDFKDKWTIWLPRQDQLQEMIHKNPNLDKTYRLGNLCKRICFFAYRNRRFTSMEQLWLAFVMKEKYNKTWNGKDWIKVEEK